MARLNNLDGGGTQVINHNDYRGFTTGACAEGKAELPGGHVVIVGSDNQHQGPGRCAGDRRQ